MNFYGNLSRRNVARGDGSRQELTDAPAERAIEVRRVVDEDVARQEKYRRSRPTCTEYGAIFCLNMQTKKSVNSLEQYT